MANEAAVQIKRPRKTISSILVIELSCRYIIHMSAHLHENGSQSLLFNVAIFMPYTY